MIELCVAEYCHKCAKFKPEAMTMHSDNEAVQTIVYCEDRPECESKMNFLDDFYTKQIAKSHE